MLFEKVAAKGSRYLDKTEKTLSSLLQQVMQGNADVSEARRTFHDIHDGASAFGFADLGEQAQDAEQFMLKLYPGGASALNGVVRNLLHATKLSYPM